MKCPRCKRDGLLKHERYEGTEIDRCTSCKGVWLDEGELINIVQVKEEKFGEDIMVEAINAAFSGITQQEQSSIEACPKCNQTMLAMNYSYSSGIIIDRCPQSHGIWFDQRELEKAQVHHEHWADELEKNREAWVGLVRAEQTGKKTAGDEVRKKEMRPTKYLVNSLIRKLLGS